MNPDFLAPFALFVWIFAAYLAGEIIAGKYFQSEDSLMSGIIYIALGYGILGYSLILLGQFGLLRLSWVTAVVGCVLILRRSGVRKFTRWLSAFGSFLNFKREGGWLAATLLGLFGVTFLFCFLPEIAHDSLVYHINLPKLYAQSGWMRTNPYDIYSYRAVLLESIFSIAFLWKMISLAKMIHWATGVLLTLAFMRAIEQKTSRHGLALLSGLCLFVTPLFINEIQTTYTDVGATFFAFLSFYLFWNALEKKRFGLFLLSGSLMGLGISTKLLTMMTAFALMASFLTLRLADRSREREADLLKPILGFVLGLLIAYAFWAVRNALVTGNPFYPFFAKFFPGSAQIPLEREFAREGVSKTILNTLLLPFLLTFSPQRFDLHHYVGPLYLLTLPFLIYGALKSKRIRFAAFTVLYFCMGWFFIAMNYRFMATILPILLYGGILGFYKWQSSFPTLKRVASLVQWVLFLSLALLFGLSAYHFRDHVRAIFSHWSPKQYLCFMERTYDVAGWANGHLPKAAKIMGIGEVRAFYFDREFVGSDVYELVGPKVHAMPGPKLLRRLRNEGFTHLLIGTPVGSEEVYPLFRPLIGMIGKKDGITEIFNGTSQNEREKRFFYRLFEIASGEKAMP